MRISKRQHDISVAQLELEIKFHRYREAVEGDPKRDEIGDVEFLRMLSLEFREITLDMEPKVKRAEKYSALKDLIRDHQKEHGMTDIEVLQAISAHFSGILKFMLRYERHGSYDKPAGVE